MFNRKQKRIEELVREVATANYRLAGVEQIRADAIAKQATRRTIMLEAGYLDVDLIDTMSVEPPSWASGPGSVLRPRVVLRLDLTVDELGALRRGVRI